MGYTNLVKLNPHSMLLMYFSFSFAVTFSLKILMGEAPVNPLSQAPPKSALGQGEGSRIIKE